jgi:hypothetical protein
LLLTLQEKAGTLEALEIKRRGSNLTSCLNNLKDLLTIVEYFSNKLIIKQLIVIHLS